MDHGIGQIVDLIDELNLDERTLILFTSDNGPTYDRLGGSDSNFFASAGILRGRKGSVYEGGLRVPLIARWPGHFKPAREIDAPCAMWDLLPTLCEAAGAETSNELDGVSLLAALTKDLPLPQRDLLYWEFPAYGGQQAIRSGDWKAIRTNLAAGPQRWQLFDLSFDEIEAFDVADEHPKVVELLAQLAEGAHTDSKLFPLPNVD
jgi:arylsulfatase A